MDNCVYLVDDDNARTTVSQEKINGIYTYSFNPFRQRVESIQEAEQHMFWIWTTSLTQHITHTIQPNSSKLEHADIKFESSLFAYIQNTCKWTSRVSGTLSCIILPF